MLFKGGEGAESSRAQLVHHAPHAGLLGSGRSGPAGGPGEAVRDDPEEKEDAPPQQKEEMRRQNRSSREDLLCRHVWNTFGAHVGDNLKAGDVRSLTRPVPLEGVPNVSPSFILVDFLAELLPVGLFVIWSPLL